MTITQFQNHCCGCGECEAVCPKNAITMKQNTQGFYYPIIDESKCVDCSLCVKHCTFNQEASEKNTVLAAYAVKHTDEEIRAHSQSGGLFTALSDYALENGGVVYGCELVDCRTAIHTRATTKEERDRFRGSKYIQSQTHGIFESVKSDVESGLWVLFSGTSCQVNAVCDYCRDVDCSKLLLVDIVCHGVPSPKVWQRYVDFMERVHRKKIVAADFRDKKFGWASHNETFTFEDGTQHNNTIFRRLFYAHYTLRRDCFECPHRNVNRVSDISIADCWGLAEQAPEFNDNKGTSLVLINTEKGRVVYDQLTSLNSMSVDICDYMQPALRMNWDVPADYEDFWEFYRKRSFKKVVDAYVWKRPRTIAKVKYWIRSTLSKCYHVIIPRKG